MRKIVLAGAVLAGLTPAAYAADMPAPAPVETIAPVEPAFSWTGFYIGAHGGWNWAETDPDADLDVGNMDNFVVGGQIGYNWQWDSWVFGLEADGSFVNNDEDLVDDGGAFLGGVEQDFLASFRGRLGFAVDRFLIYGTGGAAFTGLSIDAPGFDDADYFGWAAGGGIEYAITDNVTIGVEYLHYEFGDEEIGDGGFLPDGADIGLSNDVVRGRLNVKFDSLFN